MTGKYEFADTVFQIESQYSEVHEMCREYISEKDAEFIVCIQQRDIEFEREKSRLEDIKEGIPVRKFPDEYLETLAVYRKIADILVEYGVLLFHGSVVSVDNEGFLFTAKSGTGKSTHTRLWREYFGNRAVMINDDKPLIKITENEVRVYGTPWDGKHRISTNTSVSLKAVCIIERGAENEIHCISKYECQDMMIQQAYRPSDPIKLVKTLSLVNELSDRTGLFRMKCNMDISAAETAYNLMKGN